MPGSFAFADSVPRQIAWAGNRLEGYRVELALSPRPGTPALFSSPAWQGNLALSSLDERLQIAAREQYATLWAASSLDDIPAGLGGLELCPASALDARLPSGLVAGPPVEMRTRYNWQGAHSFRGGWFASWSEWASVDGSGRVDERPAFRVELPGGWALFARVQWDYHWKKRIETKTLCVLECYGEPGWYWDWDEWPPFCIDVTTTYWQKYCPPNNPEPGCPLITFGISSDWWRPIEADEAHTLHRASDGLERYLDLVVVQSQPLLTGP